MTQQWTATIDVNLADPDNLVDRPFFAALARIREAEPVFWSEQQHGWLLTRHADVLAAFKDPRLSAQRLHVAQFNSIAEAERPALIPNMMRYIGDWIINVDGAQHERLRRLITMAFNRKIVEGLRPQVEQLADQLLSRLEGRDEVDFVEDVAFPFTATVITRLLGIPEEHLSDLRRWAREVTIALGSHNPPRELILRAEQCFVEMTAVFGAELDKRKVAPTPDLMTQLMQARDEQDALSQDELIGMCQVLLLAGHDTTANSLVLGLLAWLRDPEQLAQFLANPQQSPTHLTELLRYIAMSSTQIRIVSEAIDWDGKAMLPGQVVFLMIAAGNRDPVVFAEPDRMLLERDPSRSLTFAPGLHHCVGHLLARMELDVCFRALFTRFDRIEVLGEELRFTSSYAFRGLERLPVRFHARK